VGAVLAAEVDAQSFGCVGEAEATYGWGLLLLLLLFLLLLLGVVVVEGDHCAFGVVELLAGGLPKTLEGREEGVDCGGCASCKQRGGVIGILHCRDAIASHSDAKVWLGEEPA